MSELSPPAPALPARLVNRIREGLAWRWVLHYRPWLRQKIGVTDTHWVRVVMDRETSRFVAGLPVATMAALEVSGAQWRTAGFAQYDSVGYPEYDVCERPYKDEAYDIILAEQVLEHVLWPLRAARNVHRMLRPGGVFVVTTPFLIRIHNHPVDCCRWTETWIKYLLAEAGFPLEAITTGSWGNRACVRANFRQWRKWIPWLHSLRNEADFPVSVWAFARKGASQQ